MFQFEIQSLVFVVSLGGRDIHCQKDHKNERSLHRCASGTNLLRLFIEELNTYRFA